MVLAEFKYELAQGERVYNFQRIFNLRMGFGNRQHDRLPYRVVGSVTKEEYESRADRYDKQLKEKLGYDPQSKSTEEKIAILKISRGRIRKTQRRRLHQTRMERRWSSDP